VYCVPPKNGLFVGDHVTKPAVKLPVTIAAVLGVAPVAGVVTVTAALVIGVRFVAANWYESVTAVPVLFVTFAFCPLIVAVVKPVNVNPVLAVSVTVAVYCVPARNVTGDGSHDTAPMLKSPVPVAVVFGGAPVVGAVTVIAAVVIGVSAVAANWYESVIAAPVLFDGVALFPLIVAVNSVSANTWLGAAVSVTDAVYCVAPWNGLCPGAHDTALTLK